MGLVVLDFHGVLERGNERALMTISNLVLENAGYSQRFTSELIQSVYGLPWSKCFKHGIPGISDRSAMELSRMSAEFSSKNFDIVRKEIELNPYARNLIETSKRDHDVILVSNCKTQPVLENFLDAVDIKDLFPKGTYFATNGHVGPSSKQDVVSSYLNGHNLLITVGDTPGDLALADIGRKKGVLSASIQYTHPHLDQMEADSDFKFTRLQDVENIVSKLTKFDSSEISCEEVIRKRLTLALERSYQFFESKDVSIVSEIRELCFQDDFVYPLINMNYDLVRQYLTMIMPGGYSSVMSYDQKISALSDARTLLGN